MLSDRMKCPFRAVGLLSFIWHGTQNMGGIVLPADQILASIPLGTRRDPRYIQLLTDCGWLIKEPEGYRIVGNEHHVGIKETLSKNGKKGAETRWAKKDGPAISGANGKDDGLLPHLISSPLISTVSGVQERERNPGTFEDAAEPPRRIDGTTINLLVGTYNRRRETMRKLTATPGITTGQRRAAETIIQACGKEAGAAVEAYLATENDYYEKRGWPLELCATDIGRIYGSLTGGGKPKSFAEEAKEFNRRQKERAEREEREAQAEHDAELARVSR